MNDRIKRALVVAALAAAYFATAKLGIELSVAKGVVTPVWIPAGLAIATLLMFGSRAWPGIALGAFAANASSDVALWVAALIAVGNTLEGVVGVYLLRRFGFDRSFKDARDVLWLVVLGAGVATTIAATNGSLALWVGNEIEASQIASRWVLWWFGDAMGVLLVAPFLLVLPAASVIGSRRRVEALALLLAVFGVSLFVFVGGNWRYPYLLFPLMIWAALRFKQLGAASSVFVISAIAVTGTVNGSVPLVGASSTESVQVLQALLAVVGVSILILASTLDERDRARDALHGIAANLSEAQSVARIGSWEWDIATGTVEWSDEMYRIYGYAPGEIAITFDTAMERVPEEDRDRIRANLADLFASDGAGDPIEYRIERPDGVRTLRGKGLTEFGPDGTPVRMVGTVQDITDQVALEAELQRLREASLRHSQALQLNDVIVQGLAAAKSAHDLGMHDKAHDYVTATLERSRRIVGDLLAASNGGARPGGFVRDEPARVSQPSDPAA